jgi:tetratricopeptide (TPR) repeat protein
MAQEADIRVGLGRALVPFGRTQPIHEQLEIAAALAEALSDPARLGWIRAYMTNCLWMSGRYREAGTCGEHAAAIAAERDDFSLRVASALYLGQVHHVRGDFRRAVAVLDQSIAALPQTSALEFYGLPGLALVISRAWLIWSLAELGEFERVLALADGTIRLAEQSDHAFSMAEAYRAVGNAYLRQGDITRSVSVLETGLPMCRSRELALWMPSLAASLGHAYAFCGRAEDGVALLRQALEQTSSLGIGAGHSQRMVWLGRAYLEAGKLTEATEVASGALGLAQERQERGQQAWIMHLMGDIAGRQGQSARAEESLRVARELGTELEMGPLLAQCRASLNRLHHVGADLVIDAIRSPRVYTQTSVPRAPSRVDGVAPED